MSDGPSYPSPRFPPDYKLPDRLSTDDEVEAVLADFDKASEISDSGDYDRFDSVATRDFWKQLAGIMAGLLRASRGEGDETRAAFELRQAFELLDKPNGTAKDEYRAWEHVQKAYDILRASSPSGQHLTPEEAADVLSCCDWVEQEPESEFEPDHPLRTAVVKLRSLAREEEQ